MSLIKCKKCGKEISDEDLYCPACGCSLQSKSNKDIKTELDALIMISVVMFIVFFFSIGLIASQSDTSHTSTGIIATSDGIKTIYSDDFTVIEEETTGSRSEDGTYTIEGKLKQNIEGNYTGLFITFTMYDKEGKKVRDTSGLMISKYLGNNIWEFTVSGNDADGIVTSYKLTSCYGY